MSPSARLLLLFMFAGLVLMHMSRALAQAPAPEIVIEGLADPLPPELLSNIQLLLSIEQKKSEPLTDEQIRALHLKAPQEIRRALEPFGFYRAQVRSELTRQGDQWTARYVVAPGPAMPLDELDLRIDGAGAGDPEFAKLKATLPLRQGEPLRHADYEKAKTALIELAAERGYLDAHLLQSELRVDLARYSASAVLHFDTGPRYRFGAVRFVQDFFDPEFLARFVRFKPGDPYVSSALVELQTALGQTEQFQQVEVQPRRDQAQDLTVPIDVLLSLRTLNKYTAGIGYGTDTGPRAKLGWERRRINRGGDRFTMELEVSEVHNSLDARYIIPVGDPRTDNVTLGANSHDDHTVSSDSLRTILGIGLTKQRGDWRALVALNAQHESFTTGSDSGVATLLIPATAITYIGADNRARPRQGVRVLLELRGADEHLVSDLSFWQVRLGTKGIVPLGEGGRFVARLDTGYTATPDFHALPVSLRFYTGGSQSVRGYAYQGLGALDASGHVIGGRYLVVGSLEYEQRVWDTVGAAVFYDKGKAFNDSSTPFDAGAGIGARWHLPLGLLQLDVARALTREGKPWRVHFAIGAEL